MKPVHRRLILMSCVYAMGVAALGLCGYAAYQQREAIVDYAAPKLAALEMPDMPDMPDVSLPSVTMPSMPRISMPKIDLSGVQALVQDSLEDGHAALRGSFAAIDNFTVDMGGHLRRGGQSFVSLAAGVPEEAVEWIAALQPPAPPPAPPPSYTLTEMISKKEVEVLAKVEPASGDTPKWEPDQLQLNVESVLVPRQITVISSSRDGRIAEIPVENGDMFMKGDILVAYGCADLEAEAEIVGMEKRLTKKKIEGSDRLFKLDIISDVDRLGIQVEDKRADAKMRLYEAKLEDCRIRAEFDGRVTNRLANPGEYTRTDRVLLEVASLDTLQAEFLIPSRWLRWVDVGAPLTIRVSETDKEYTAQVTRIHGEVDPVSQSIQVVAALDKYDDRLLPGMSGQAVLDIDKIRKSGVKGFLQQSASITAPPATPE